MRFGVFFVVVFAIVAFLANALYVVDQREVAIVVQFGKILKQELTPGLKIKMPVIQEVRFFDKRLQNLSFNMSDSSEVVAADQKTMKVDAYAKYKIVDPQKFYESARDDASFKLRFESIVESCIREVIGQVKFKEILGEKRSDIRRDIINLANKDVKNFGVDVIDIRLVRVNLPDKARNAVYERMRTEREKEAKEIRAIGNQESETIKAIANKESSIIVAESKKQSEITRGQGDSTAIKIYADAYGKDKDFYEYYRSLDIYKHVFDKKSSLVLSSDNKFLKYFNNQ
jgi:membrane protease subunit HflC